MRLMGRGAKGVLMLFQLFQLCAATGCAGWRQVSVSPEALDSAQEVRLTLGDGSRIVLVNPKVADDSIFGTNASREFAYALADVRRMALPRASSSKQAAGTTFVAAAVGAYIVWWIILIAAD
jgi:predicted CoA-binding protein